jgi:hypothetical protein
MGALSRRTALQVILSSASAALLAACTNAATPSVPTTAPAAAPKPTAAAVATVASASAAAPTPSAKDQIKTGGKLRVAMVGDITALDPFVWSPNNSNTVGQVHDQLITYDETFTPNRGSRRPGT